jgi:hypothetical protein
LLFAQNTDAKAKRLAQLSSKPDQPPEGYVKQEEMATLIRKAIQTAFQQGVLLPGPACPEPAEFFSSTSFNFEPISKTEEGDGTDSGEYRVTMEQMKKLSLSPSHPTRTFSYTPGLAIADFKFDSGQANGERFLMFYTI